MSYTVKVPGSCGELAQGYLNNSNFLISCPIDIYSEVTVEINKENDEIIKNIRLWDHRPLLTTYNQIQTLRQYYDFQNIDVDRYNIGGDYRQVMLGAREMNQDLLSGQAQTWINKKLKYTHGYGVTMSPVNMVTSEGLPEFFMSDIPTQVNVDIPLENAAIYYGEKTDEYVIANTDSTEFHYPQGDDNVYINYDGTGGVLAGSFIKKAVLRCGLRVVR